MPTLVLATANPGKARELRDLLAEHLNLDEVTLATPDAFGLSDFSVDETGATFAENARLKAVALMQRTGCAALADDSGLCVDALDGKPGVHSARWAGSDASDAERTARLLSLLQGVPDARRAARFVCAVAVAAPGGEVAQAEGVCEGVILRAPRGLGGFGYDPVFFAPALGCTFAEASAAQKNFLSHRARALSALSPFLLRLLGLSPRV